MSIAEVFIQKYKTLEDLLEAKYREEGRDVSSAVYQFLCDKESVPFRIKLDLCRQVRNLLSHSAYVDGIAPVSPAQPLIECLDETIEYLKRPTLAIERGTPGNKLFKAVRTDRISWLVKRMEEKGFSHVPVMEEDCVFGVFSVSTFFTLAKANKLRSINEGTKIYEIESYLTDDEHLSERFLFVKKTATVSHVQNLFSSRKEGEKRIASVFVTEDGTRNTKLLSYITPWDVMG